MIRLTIGLGTAVMILTLLCTVACGGGGDGSLAKGGINMIVVSGQARIQSGEGNTSVVEGQEAVLTTGDQITAGEAGAKLLLVDGSLLDLKPDTDLQVITFSAEGTAKLRQLKGRLEVQAASPLLTIEVSTFGSEESAFKTMRFTATPTVRETAFGLEIDGLNAHLTVEAGEVNVTHDDGTETISAGGEVKATPEELIVSQNGAIAGLTATATPTATHLSQPSPTATATPTPLDFLYPAPGLNGPPDGSDFKPDETILLIWDTPPTPLSEDEWYEVHLRRDGDVSYTVVRRVKEETWKVESRYNPGRYQWRIVVVRGQEEGPKEIELSPPSQTWSFSWLSPVVQTPVATPSPSISGASSPSLTVYLRGTNNLEGFAKFSGEEHVDAGMIYTEGGTVYGNVAVRIRDTVYHPGEESSPEQLPDPWRVDFEFDQLLVERTGNKAGFNSKKAQFWVGTLDGDSAVGEDNPYRLTMKLYEGNKLWKSIQVFFTVADAPESPGSRDEDIVIPPTRQP